MARRISQWIAILTLAPGLAAAGGFGTLSIEGNAIALGSACAVAPRFDMQGWGRPEVTLLLSDQALDCAALAGWANPDSGAFDAAVERGSGVLLSVSFQPGLKLGKVSIYGVGYTLGNDSCEGCQVQAAHGGAGLQGAAKTTKPLMVSSTALAFDIRFDLPKPAAATRGDELPRGGGEPGQAYLACLAAYREGDYAALQRLLPEGKAEDKWGYYDDADERRTAIQGEDAPKSAEVLEGWRQGDSALLVVEVPHPWSAGDKVKAVVGLGFDGANWRVREERLDFGGTILEP